MGVCSPLNRAIIGRYCASSDIPKAILCLAILFNLMPFLSPSIGVVLASFGSWRLVFWVLGVVVTLITLFLRWLMPKDQPRLNAPLPLYRVHHRYRVILSSKPFWRYSIGYLCLIGFMLSTYAVMPFWLVVPLHVPESHYTLYTLALTISSLMANLSARYALRHVLIDTVLKTALAVFFACFMLTLRAYLALAQAHVNDAVIDFIATGASHWPGLDPVQYRNYSIVPNAHRRSRRHVIYADLYHGRPTHLGVIAPGFIGL